MSSSVAAGVFPGGAALGRRVYVNGGPKDGAQIVGVVNDVVRCDLSGARGAVKGCDVYFPLAQADTSKFGQMTFVLRARTDPVALTPGVRAAVARAQPNLAVLGVQST